MNDRAANTARWKTDKGAFHAYLQDTLYDHLQIADELARDSGMEPKDRLRALSDFTRNAERILSALSQEQDGKAEEPRSVAHSPGRRTK